MNFFTVTHKSKAKQKYNQSSIIMIFKTPDKSPLMTARFLPLLLRP